MIDRNTESYNQIDALLSTLQQTHSRAASSLFLGATTHEDPRLQMLADRLASRQTEMVEFMMRSRDTATSEVLSTWLQYTPVVGIKESLEQLVNDPSTRDLSEHILQIQNKITDLLETLNEETNSPEVASFVGSLKERESTELKETAKAINDMKYL